MRVARLRVKNWMCFRGEHVLDLDAKVYAVFARYDADPAASNAGGKTALVEAIRYALTGEHRFETDDEWISEGEGAGEVELTTDDGFRILRSRTRGKRTNVYLFAPGEEPAMQDAAQEKIEEVIGLSKQDVDSTVYWEQKQISRFVTARASEGRTKMVSAWMKLDPIKDCEKRVASAGASLEVDAATAAEHRRLVDEREAEIEKAFGAKYPGTEMAPALAAVESCIEQQKGRLAGAEEAFARNAELLVARGKIEEYEQVLADGKDARVEFDRVRLPVLNEAWTKASDDVRRAAEVVGAQRRKVDERRAVAKGEFDGRCPIAEIECPARARINEDREKGRISLEIAEGQMAEVMKVSTAAYTAEQEARTRLQAAQRVEERLRGLRERAGKLAPVVKAAKAAGAPEDSSVLRARLENERGVLDVLQQDAFALRSWIETIGKIESTRATLAAKRAEIDASAEVYREAAAIFRAAQRRVAERSLSAIEEEANGILAEARAPLTVAMSWSREGRGLATSCDACGHPFPTSAKVKSCTKCGAERGLKVENKLNIRLSKRSGAMDDLAGAAVQLAASRWLRGTRGSRWSTAMMDEPFTACDEPNRKGLAKFLATALPRVGIHQAFVVSHTVDTDMFPGAILVESDGKWSRAKVVS